MSTIKFIESNNKVYLVLYDGTKILTDKTMKRIIEDKLKKVLPYADRRHQKN
jgi:hypothetical protein